MRGANRGRSGSGLHELERSVETPSSPQKIALETPNAPERSRDKHIRILVRDLFDMSLPMLVQSGERVSPEWKAHWALHCRCFANGNMRDPYYHTSDFLRDFLKDTIPYFEHFGWLQTFVEAAMAGELEALSGKPSASCGPLVEKIKRRRAKCESFSSRWVQFCQTLGGGRLDPARHSETFLLKFLSTEVDPEEPPTTQELASNKASLKGSKGAGKQASGKTGSVSALAKAPSLARDVKEHDVCPICLDPPENMMITTCGHVFCEACIMDWAAKRKESKEKIGQKLDLLECPMCNQGLQRSDVRKVEMVPTSFASAKSSTSIKVDEAK